MVALHAKKLILRLCGKTVAGNPRVQNWAEQIVLESTRSHNV
jgi:hypothetical protein